MEVPVETCAVDRTAELRFDYSVDDLAEDIRLHGQLQPVLAYMKDGTYYVFAGVRRCLAVKKLYQTYGEPGTVRAMVFENEPSEREKIEIALSENSKRNDLNIYEKIALALSHPDEVERVVSKHFVRDIKLLMPNVTVVQLRRWFEIEKALGGVKLRIPHLQAIAQLEREEQDFAVFFFHVFNMPEDVSRFNLKRLFANTPLSSDYRRKLEELNIKPPGMISEGAQQEIRQTAPGEKEGEEAKSFETVSEQFEQEEMQDSEATGSETLEEEPDVLLMSEKVHSIVVSGRVYVLYLETQPEIEMIKVQDGQEIELEGKRYRIRLVL